MPKTLIITLIGFGEDEFPLEDLIEHLKRLRWFHSFETLSLPSSTALKDAYKPERNQYYSTRILSNLLKETSMFKADRILGVVDVDLYVEGLNFVFGEAQFPGRIALISLFRLKPAYYGEGDGRLFKSRVRKEAVHELGHTFGLTHCPNPTCVMHFSNHIYDTDRKEDKPCQTCHKNLQKVLEK